MYKRQEYGDIQGLISLKDIVEEVVGDFDQGFDKQRALIQEQSDGSLIVDGGIYIRELNRSLDWALPLGGAKTLSGLIIEHLEMMPHSSVGVKIEGYPMVIERLASNTVEQVRLWPTKQGL